MPVKKAAKLAAKKAAKATKKAAAKASPKKAAAKKPRLLSGGNPQIPKGEGDEPVQAYLAAIPGWKQALAREVDGVVQRTVPGVRKAVKWNSAFYGAPGKESWFLNFHVFTNYVKVAFFDGASLKPVPPGASKHEKVRYLDVREGALDAEQLERWVRQAAGLPGWKP